MGTSAVLSGVEQPKKKFPLVAKSKKTNLHVLFISEQSGTVIVSDNDSDPLGIFSDTFIECTNQSVWTILDSVTITFKS